MGATQSFFQKFAAALSLAAIISVAPMDAMGWQWLRSSARCNGGWNRPHRPYHNLCGWQRPYAACHASQAGAALRPNRNETRNIAIKAAVIVAAVAAVGACCYFFGGPSRVFPHFNARVNLGGVPINLGLGAEFTGHNRGGGGR